MKRHYVIFFMQKTIETTPDSEDFIVLKITFNKNLTALEEEIIMYQGVIALTQISQKNNYCYIITLHMKDFDAVIRVCETMQHFSAYEIVAEALNNTYAPIPIPIDKDLSIIDPSIAPPTQHYILLEAGTSFGTGHHPSTQLLLRWLHHNPPQDKSICDVGCGSGILGVYAAMRGAQRVCCVDISDTALVDTQHLASSNHVHVHTSKTIPSQYFDIVVSNCESSVLLLLKDTIENVIPPGGYWIITGIIGRIWKKIQHQMPQWPMVYTQKQGPWVLIGLQKPITDNRNS